MRPKAPKIGNMNECRFHTIPGVQGGDKIVDHLDTNVENNNASNLRWCRDMKENMANPLSVAKRQRAAANRHSRAAKRKAYMEEIMRQAMTDTPF